MTTNYNDKIENKKYMIEKILGVNVDDISLNIDFISYNINEVSFEIKNIIFKKKIDDKYLIEDYNSDDNDKKYNSKLDIIQSILLDYNLNSNSVFNIIFKIYNNDGINFRYKIIFKNDLITCLRFLDYFKKSSMYRFEYKNKKHDILIVDNNFNLHFFDYSLNKVYYIEKIEKK